MPKRHVVNKRAAKPLLQENQTQKRRERAQELRSTRRQGVLLAKRRKPDPSASGGASSPAGAAAAVGVTGIDKQEWSQVQLEAVVKGVRDSSLGKVLPYLADLRKLLSLEDAPVEEVVEGAGLAPRLIQLLGAGATNDEIQIQATW